MKKSIYAVIIALVVGIGAKVEAGDYPNGDLTTIINGATDGEVINLTGTAYTFSVRANTLTKSLTIQADPSLSSRPVITVGQGGIQFIATGSTAQTLTLKGLEFDGNALATGLTQGKNASGGNFIVTVDNCKTSNFASSTSLFSYTAATGLSVYGDLIVKNSEFYGPEPKGLMLTAGTTTSPNNITFSNCLIKGFNTGNNTIQVVASTALSGITIDHCTFLDGSTSSRRPLLFPAGTPQVVKNCVFVDQPGTGANTIAVNAANDKNVVFNAGAASRWTNFGTLLTTDPAEGLNGVATESSYINAGTDGKTIGYYGMAVAATPTISTTGTLSAVNTTYGTASSNTQFSVSGANMSAGISVNPPVGFQVSTASDFTSNVGSNGSPITVGTAGTINATTVYVRLAATATVSGSPYSGNIALTSTGATQVNVATVSSTVSAATPTVTVTPIGTYTYNGSAQGPIAATNTGTGTSYTFSYAGTGTTTYTASATLPTASGTYTATATVAADGNYAEANSSATAFSILSTGSVTAENTTVSSLTLTPSSVLTISATGSLVIDANTEVASVAVAAGGKLTISNGRTLMGAVTLESAETSTATLIDEYAVPTVSATVKQHVTAGRNWYMSSPVSAADFSWLSRGTSVQGWDEATKAWIPVTSGTLVRGKGYIQVATSTPSVTGSTGTVNVTGTTNSGDVAITVSRTESGTSRGFNLIGNPYPSYLKWSGVNGFITDATNDSISTSFWYRTKNSSDAYVFTTYNGSSHTVVGGSSVNSVLNEFIPPMQAFWIRVNANTAVSTHNVNLTFKNTMRLHGVGDNNVFKAPKADERQLVRLQLANGNQTDETLIYFDAAAVNTFDNFDSPKMLNNSTTLPDLYSIVGEERLAINGLYESENNMELPLGFTLKAAATGLKFKVSELNNFTNGTKVYLMDKEQNTQIELLPTTEYYFNTTASSTNNESRFSLLFRTPASTTGIDNAAKTNTQVYVNANNELVISSPKKNNYAIFNAVGQLIENGTVNSKPQTVNFKLQTGIFLVKVGNESKRLIIK